MSIYNYFVILIIIIIIFAIVTITQVSLNFREKDLDDYVDKRSDKQICNLYCSVSDKGSRFIPSPRTILFGSSPPSYCDPVCK